MWDNVQKYCTFRQVTDDNIIRRTRIARWIPKTTNTHSEYVTLNAPPLQQWLHERASMLRDTWTGCLVTFHFHICLRDTSFTPKSHFIHVLSFFKYPQKHSWSRLNILVYTVFSSAPLIHHQPLPSRFKVESRCILYIGQTYRTPQSALFIYLLNKYII